MQTNLLINNIYRGNKDFLTCSNTMNYLENNQEELLKLLYITLTNDKYLEITQKLWKLIKEDEDWKIRNQYEIGLVKYNLYCYVLKQPQFNLKTARYICIKEREFKKLNYGLLGSCANEQAIDFIINSYSLGINNIIEAVANCHSDKQINTMDILLSKLTNTQKTSAINKFMQSYINGIEKDLALVTCTLQYHCLLKPEIREHEQVKKIIFFNEISQKIPQKNNKIKSQKI